MNAIIASCRKLNSPRIFSQKFTLVLVSILTLLLSQSCKQRYTFRESSGGENLAFDWRERNHRILPGRMKFAIKSGKWTKYYRKNFNKSNKLKKLVTSNPNQYYFIKEYIYNITDSKGSLAFSLDNVTYNINLTLSDDKKYRIYLEEDGEKYYLIHSWDMSAPLKLEELKAAFEGNNLNFPIIEKILILINKNNTFTRDFGEAVVGMEEATDGKCESKIILYDWGCVEYCENGYYSGCLTPKKLGQLRSFNKNNFQNAYRYKSECTTKCTLKNLDEIKKLPVFYTNFNPNKLKPSNKTGKNDAQCCPMPLPKPCKCIEAEYKEELFSVYMNEVGQFKYTVSNDNKEIPTQINVAIMEIENHLNKIRFSYLNNEPKLIEDSIIMALTKPATMRSLLTLHLTKNFSNAQYLSEVITDAIIDSSNAQKVNSIKIDLKNTNDSLIMELEKNNGNAGTLALKTSRLPLHKGFSQKSMPLQNSFIDVETVHIRTDNNRINDITITGMLFENGLNRGRIVLTNLRYSLNFAHLNKRVLWAAVPGTNNLFINYADLINYTTSNTSFSYMVKNQEFVLSPQKNKCSDVLKKRALYDYLSLRLFVDPFGFLSNTPNGLIQAEGTVLIPSNVRSWGSWSIFSYSMANFDYILANTVNSNAIKDRTMIGQFDLNKQKFESEDSSRIKNYGKQNLIDNLDFFRKYNYKFDFRVAIMSREVKWLNSWYHIETGMTVIGANAKLFLDTMISNKFTPIDTFNVMLHKFMPMIGLRGELRPDAIFGLNWGASILFPGYVAKGNNNFNNPNNPSFMYDYQKDNKIFSRRPIFMYDLNYYALISRDASGGLFFRHSGYLSYYGYRKWGFFPQFLVGYSTNINAFINSVTKSRQ